MVCFDLIGVCPVLCSGRGDYINGRCQCIAGWKGQECSLKHDECEVPDCNGHGKCSSGKCVCARGFKGEFCDIGKLVQSPISYLLDLCQIEDLKKWTFFDRGINKLFVIDYHSGLSAPYVYGSRLLRRGCLPVQEGLERA